MIDSCSLEFETLLLLIAIYLAVSLAGLPELNPVVARTRAFLYDKRLDDTLNWLKVEPLIFALQLSAPD